MQNEQVRLQAQSRRKQMQTLMNDNKQMGVNFDYKERLRKEHEARVQDSVN
jgi:hypothetical protein